jgi:hypothetical protein
MQGRAFHDAQAKVEEQARDVAAQAGRVRAADAHLPLAALLPTLERPAPKGAASPRLRTRMQAAEALRILQGVQGRVDT